MLVFPVVVVGEDEVGCRNSEKVRLTGDVAAPTPLLSLPSLGKNSNSEKRVLSLVTVGKRKGPLEVMGHSLVNGPDGCISFNRDTSVGEKSASHIGMKAEATAGPFFKRDGGPTVSFGGLSDRRVGLVASPSAAIQVDTSDFGLASPTFEDGFPLSSSNPSIASFSKDDSFLLSPVLRSSGSIGLDGSLNGLFDAVDVLEGDPKLSTVQTVSEAGGSGKSWETSPRVLSKENSSGSSQSKAAQGKIAGAEKVTVVFPMRFKDSIDIALATSFLQEFVEARRTAGLNNAPPCSWSPSTPQELKGAPNDALSANAGFVTFVIFPRHVEGKKVDRVIWSLSTFHAYVSYHVKCSEGFMHTRMRRRVESLIQILQTAG
ncbi:uncharacterized protein LOC111024802 isoform X2 [Momordica charantia]|uniref:Arp2/3 complex 34 kDa subunit n=1 Tax=Momordica charantia TaxID=3673 RepID=A0A6J1DVE2_MOMCH|nr:uncharacterized protein LOC111024802 isoform X2 [Momordica charantia]